MAESEGQLSEKIALLAASVENSEKQKKAELENIERIFNDKRLLQNV